MDKKEKTMGKKLTARPRERGRTWLDDCSLSSSSDGEDEE